MSEERIAIDTLRIRPIKGVKKETPTVSTLFFNDSRCATAEPGQYAMIWMPGIGEVPMSLSVMDPPERSAITVRKRGKTTEALLACSIGDPIGVRGPYGRGYSPIRGRALLIGGGTGVASLTALAENLVKNGSEIVFVLGADCEEEVLFPNRLKQLEGDRFRLIVTTEDGSAGIKGRPTATVRSLIKKNSFDMVYTCGPELMMREIFDISEETELQLQASLERIIKCGVGLCGHCSIGPYRVCKDGPVFPSSELREVIDEFGRYTRDHLGRRIPLE